MSTSVKNPVTLLKGWVEKVEHGANFTTTSFRSGGDPGMMAVVAATVAAYPRPAEVEDETTLWELAEAKTAVTMLTLGANMLGGSVVNAVQARLIVAASGALAYLPKGNTAKGFRLDPAAVLDLVVGYNKVDELAERLERVRSRFPLLEELTLDRLAQLPERADDEDCRCTLAVFGTWRSPDGLRCDDAIWLLHSFMSEDDIAEGVLYVRPESYGTSEHGSMYGSQLVNFGGAVVGEISVPLRDAIAYVDRPHDEVLDLVNRSSRR